MQWLLGCAGFVFMFVVASAQYDFSDQEGELTRDAEEKRSLGWACRCCTTRREPWCCNACVYRMRTPTPFYTGKRSSDVSYNPDYFSREEKRGRYRARSRCGCCFTRRLQWCCQSCMRYRSFGKRSETSGDDFTYDTERPTFWEAEKPQPFISIPVRADRYTDDSANLDLAQVYDPIDVPVFPLDNVRKDCLCCLFFNAVPCCDKCKNAL